VAVAQADFERVTHMSRKAVRVVAVALFVVMTGLIGAMAISFGVWVLSFGLLPQSIANLVLAAGGALGGWLGYQHTAFEGWLEPDD
jgi:hypothetical protein